jgi:hypothetical protein
MQAQSQPPEPAYPEKVAASLDELESLLKVPSPDRDFQPFWSENWKPPVPDQRDRPEPQYRGDTWGSAVDLAEAFGTRADGDRAHASTNWAPAETSMSDSSDTCERDDQSPDAPGRGGQDVPPDRS